MPKYLSDAEVLGGKQYLSDDEVLGSSSSSNRSILDTVSGGIGSVVSDIKDGFSQREKREREAMYARSNEANRKQLEAQGRSGTSAELQAMADADAARERYDSSAAEMAKRGVNFGRDLAVGGAQGVISLGESAVGLGDLATGWTGVTPGGVLKDVAGYDPEASKKALGDLKSDAGKERDAIYESAKGFTGTLLTLGSNPGILADKIAESLVGTVGAGAIGGKIVQMALPKVVAAAEAAGLTGAAAESFIADKISKIAVAGSAGAEGVQQAGNLSETARQGGREWKDYAGPAIASGIGTAAIAGVSGRVAQKIGIGDIEADIAMRGVRGPGVKTDHGFLPNRVAVEGFKEGVIEEMPQSIQEAAWENVAMGRPWGQGLGKAAATGLATGFGMGGGHAAVARPGDSSGSAPGTPDISNGYASVSASDVLGAPESAMGSDRKAPTESEKALFAPKGAGSLDRVAEIDAKLADQTTLDAPALIAEREQITASWPKPVLGNETTVTLPNGSQVKARWAVVDAGEVTPSHDVNLRSNAAYDQTMQPRDRGDRHGYEMQIQNIVGNFNPALVDESPLAGMGAPTIRADGMVVDGNGREISIQRVYQANGAKAESLRAHMATTAEQKGIPASAYAHIQKPQFVRIIDHAQGVNYNEFARQANESVVARMSPSEQARSDAARIDSLEDLNPTETGEFSSGSSASFVRRFMAKLPATEHTGLIDASGQLSQAGYQRIRNAVLAKAYGDSPVLQRMVESMDSNVRNVGAALLRVAPQVAKVREAIGEGALHEADITPDLMAAVEELSSLRDKGTAVSEALAQGAMFGDKLSPEARELLSFLDANTRSPRRIAEFIQSYINALEAAGSPNQGSLLGDATAPAKSDLLTVARRAIHGDTATGSPDASSTEDGQENRGQPKDAQSNQAGAGGNEAASGSGEWVAFPPDSGTLGIPRAEMPQIKGDHRGALIQFLEGRGITHETVELPATQLKPTQAEFSTKKARGWKEVRDGVDRSVLASSDGYILDGHHQWVMALANGETEQVIRFSVPIKELLAATFQFPSVKRSEGSNVVDLRAKSRQDFKDALYDLSQIATKHTRAAMLPESTPNLMPTLVKLSGAAIAEVGYQIKDIIAHVKQALKSNPEFKSFWNKINTSTYRKAAEQAANEQSRAHVDDLFSVAEARKGQQDLFAQPGAKASTDKVVMIDGRPYKYRVGDDNGDNFYPGEVDEYIAADVLERADEYVRKYYSEKADPVISKDEHERALSLLNPLIKRAEAAKASYDQKVVDIAKRAGAIGQQLAPVKGLKRAIPKLVKEEKFDIEGMKDMLRSTIVVSSYEDAQRVVDEIEKEFELLRDPKNRTSDTPLRSRGKEIPPEDRRIYGGYADVLVNVILPGDVIAEIQINIPSMLAAKEAQGHKLYEAFRDAPKDSPLGREINGAMQEFYAAAFAARRSADSFQAAADFRKAASLDGKSDSGLGKPFGTSSPESDIPNTLPSGNTTRSSPPNESKNSQPSGNLSGTLIASTSNPSIANGDLFDYTNSEETSRGQKNGQNRENSAGGAQGKEPGAASATGGQREAAGFSDGSGGRNRQPDRNANDGTGGQAGSQQSQEPAGKGGNTEGVRVNGDGNRTGRNAGLPAGRDIPAKSGRNYAFGGDDLTYTGSWPVKARQNVEALELLKKLEMEGRQATREEQAVLAKFIGWGASELANNLFGPQDNQGKTKLDRQLEALANYDEAIASLGDKPYLTNSQYRDYQAAFTLLQSKNPALNWYTAGSITKAMLDAAKPDASVRKWGELRDRIRAAMTADEFKEAAKSTQYAHYTSKAVVKSVLAALDKMGFKGGTILEPGAGIGVFPGLLDGAVAGNSIYTGIEMDPVTGGILKQLFPDERILVESFIESKLPENFYDVAIGNPPFSGEVTVLADPKYVKHAFKLHDYFFAKSLDSVKPGGLVVFVTSRYTMDKKGDKARSFMAERADLVGAIRLPQTAFQKNAGTDVVTDVLFLRKKVAGQTFDQAQAWMGLSEVKTPEGMFPINEYFVAHPEMVLGEHSGKGKMQNSPDPQYTLLAKSGDIEAQFAVATGSLPADVFVAGRGSAAEAARVREMDFDPKAMKEGGFYVSPAGVLMQREGGVGVRADAKHQKNAELLKDYITLRNAVKQTQLDQLNDGNWESSLKILQDAYAGFVKKHGRLHQNTTYMQKVKVDELDEDGTPTGSKVEDEEQRRRFPVFSAIKGDPDYTLALALEDFNDETGEIKESKWLSARTLGKPVEAEIKTPTDALLATLNDTGIVDIAAVAERIGMSEQEAIDSLGSLIYEDPAQGWVMADEYLSGNVKKKLAAAEEAAKSDKAYARNVEALKAVQPAARSPEQITPQIGMNWIPGEVYQQFLYDVTGVKAKIEYVKRTREWVLTTISGEGSPRATSDWGVGDKAHAGWLMDKALSGAAISLNKSVSDGKGGSKLVFDPDRTEAANQKRAELRAKFREWLFQDAQRTTELVQLYNDKFNTNVQRKFDGSHLTLPGTSKLFNIFDHVKRGAWRVIQTGNAYLAHAVGSGKTFEMVISAMEQKRLGKIKKPMIIVPGHMLQQFASEWQQLYPTARLMVADEENFHTDNRRRFVSRVAMSDLDGVIMTHSSFGLLDLDPEFKQKMIERELDVLRASYTEAGGDLDEIGDKKVRKEPKVKRIEAQIEALEQQLAKAMSSEGKDKNVRFDELGVDFLYVDEAHLFRKLSFATARQMKGIDPNGSKMAWDLYMKTRWLAEKNPTRNLVMASGTAITNTTAELYTVQRFMAPQVLEENGLSGFDDWASQFGEESTTIESTASGKYEPVSRFQNFVNVGEMTQMFRDFADVLNEDHLAALLGDKRPRVKDGARKSIITPKTDSYVRFLKEDLAPRIEASRNWKPSFEHQYNPDPIIAINIDARLAAIDMRFMEPSLPNDPDSKLNHLIDGVIRVYKESANNEYKDKQGNIEDIKGATQMVFFETGFGKMVAQRRGFNARAWMEKRLRDAGIPTSQVAFMEDYKKSSAKLKLFSDVNKGKVRVLVGSSAAMGTGVNAQQRLVALHHLDAPYVPAILEQREGRIIRQGNKNPEVQIYAYSMFGSFDENQWSMLARKKFFIEQAMSGDPNIRSIEDVGEVNQLQLAAGLVAENPYVMQHAGAKAEVDKLTRLYRSHEEQRGRMQDDYQNAGRTIEYNERALPGAEKDAAKVAELSGDKFSAKVGGQVFDKRKDWGEAVLAKAKDLSDKLSETRTKVGEISGFAVEFVGGMAGGQYVSRIDLQLPMPAVLAHGGIADPAGMATRAVNALVELSREPVRMRKLIDEAKSKREALSSRLDAPFPLAEQLANKIRETADLEQQMLSYGVVNAGLAREQELEDAWQAKTGAITPMFSRGNGRGMALRDLNAVVDRVAKGFKNLPRVHVLASPSDLSTKDPAQKALRDFIRKSDAWNDVEGATHDGEIYLFASGMADEARAEHVLATHEITHYGLRGAIGKDLDAALQNVLLMNAKVRKASVAMKRARNLKSNIEAVEEVLADIPTADLAKLRGWRKVVQVVRNWLNKAGAKNLAARLDAWMKSGLSDQEKADLFVADLVNAARDWVKRGNGGGMATMGGTRLAEQKLADDLAEQEKWLAREAKVRGFKSIDELAEKDYKVFENLAALWRKKNPVETVLLSRAIQPAQDLEKSADDIINQKSATVRPLDFIAKGITQAVKIDKLTSAAYDKVASILDRFTPDQIKAGIVSDYGIPEAVLDRRSVMEGRQKQQLRGAGKLLEKLSTLTRAESRVAYEWMNNENQQAADYFEQQLPAESLTVLNEVKGLIDQLSQEAVRLGQLDAEAFKKNRFAYLHRSYIKHTAELTAGESKSLGRAISILGDQYKGRGMTDAVDMAKIKNIFPDWWQRKLQAGKADKGLKGEKFIRLERRAHSGEGTTVLPGFGDKSKGRLQEVAYWPAGEPIPSRYSTWDQAGTWEVRDTKGGKVVVWRDFTRQERESMGEIDEARYAIAKTLHNMIHDTETGRYLEWLGQKYAKKEGESIDGTIVEASERMFDTFKPGEWVKVPETSITGTKVKKYGTLAGRYLPGPIWNDVRQMGGRFKPLGDTYAKIQGAWKTSKTALSPAVHMNNVMANFVMADWHDVTAGHILKALKLMTSKDTAAAEVLARFGDSGGTVGTWATKELQQEQLRPLLDALEKELGVAGEVSGQVGVMSALQLALKGKFPSAWDAFKPSKTGQIASKGARAMLDLYEAEDQVFRLAAWLKAKEDGGTDLHAGKVARKSFLDYHINAPWVQMMRSTTFPFVAFTYRSVPMLAEIAAKKPWKLMKLGLVAGAINALGYMLSGGDEDDERKLLPEEKAGRIWGITPKLVRMPWNDASGSPVFLDVRRWIPVGDIFDTGATHAALPILPSMQPGGPLMLFAEIALNKQGFTGKSITLDTDTPVEQAQKFADYLYKAFAPNIAVLPGTYAWTGIVNAGSGKTDSFGREQSLKQSIISSVGIKVGSYPKDVLQLNAQREAQAKMMEIDRNITALKREYQKKGITADELQEKAADQMAKKRKILEKLQGRMAGG
jgi:N12 class adenine-specific DNA methylase